MTFKTLKSSYVLISISVIHICSYHKQLTEENIHIFCDLLSEYFLNGTACKNVLIKKRMSLFINTHYSRERHTDALPSPTDAI